MIYSYQPKNKFKHLLLDTSMAAYHPSGDQRYAEQRKWIKENIGSYNKHWAVNYGFYSQGRKLYRKEVDALRRRREVVHCVLQWSFQTEDDAMAFKLRWME